MNAVDWAGGGVNRIETPEIGSTCRAYWPQQLQPGSPEVDVRELPNPGHGRSLPARRSVDGSLNYCLSCPRVVSSRQRFCETHRSIRCAWLSSKSGSTSTVGRSALPEALVAAVDNLATALAFFDEAAVTDTRGSLLLRASRGVLDAVCASGSDEENTR